MTEFEELPDKNVPIEKVEKLLQGQMLTSKEVMFLHENLPYVGDSKEVLKRKENVLSPFVQSKLN